MGKFIKRFKKTIVRGEIAYFVCYVKIISLFVPFYHVRVNVQ